MSNMSYCRFQNTESDLKECAEVLQDLAYGAGSPLSDEELSAARRLVGICFDVVSIVVGNTDKPVEDLLDSTHFRQNAVKDLLKKLNDNADTDKEWNEP